MGGWVGIIWGRMHLPVGQEAGGSGLMLPVVMVVVVVVRRVRGTVQAPPGGEGGRQTRGVDQRLGLDRGEDVGRECVTLLDPGGV